MERTYDTWFNIDIIANSGIYSEGFEAFTAANLMKFFGFSAF
jgi:hypothetical protein